MQRVINILSNYLSDQDKILLRSTNKEYLALIKNAQMAPYITRAQFVIALTGYYQFKKDRYSFDIVYEKNEEENFKKPNKKYGFYKPLIDTNEIDSAWLCYSNTIGSGSKNPAMLYKLKDFNNILMNENFILFKNNEDINNTQRRYNPKHHTWKTNVAWLLAQIHQGRSFTLFSSMTQNNKFRDPKKVGTDKKIYSAFSREIAGAVKANYEIQYDKPTIFLVPKKDVNYLKIKLTDIDVSENEMEIYLDKLQKKNPCIIL